MIFSFNQSKNPSEKSLDLLGLGWIEGGWKRREADWRWIGGGLNLVQSNGLRFNPTD